MINQQIDYESTRQRLKAFLADNEKFKDVNFEASGVSTLINMLAYNAHYLGMYAYMLNNESSIDSAQLQQSIYSKARGLGYLPKGKRSARVEVVIKCELDQYPEAGYITMTRFKQVMGKSMRSADVRFFANPDDVFLYDYQKVGDKFVFYSKPTVLVEGSKRDWKFQVSPSVQYQKFIIKDKTIDIDTLRVFVKSSNDDVGTIYTHAQSVFDVNSESLVYYITTTHDGYYEIFFGNGIFGKQPEADSIITCEYLTTMGESGNGCTDFTLAGFIIEPTEVSNGGSDGESLETTRFNAIHHFRQQNRVFQEEDYRSAILARFRNVQAVNVWGGEEHFQKSYGKVFLSVKPYYADTLSGSAKDEIRNVLLKRNKKLVAEPVFIDPEFIDCYIDLIIVTDLDKTASSFSEVETEAIKAVNNYNDVKLNVFDTYLSDVELGQEVKKSHKAIKSVYTRKTLQKTVNITRNSTSRINVFFGNALIPNTIKSTFEYGIYKFDVYDLNGKLYAKADAENPINQEIGTVDYETGTISVQYPTTSYTGIEKVTFNAKPQNPDVASKLNNIVRIARVRVANE